MACWLLEPQPISNNSVKLLFLHRAGRYRSAKSAFTSLFVSSHRDVDGVSDQGMLTSLTLYRHDHGVGKMGDSRHTMDQ